LTALKFLLNQRKWVLFKATFGISVSEKFFQYIENSTSEAVLPPDVPPYFTLCYPANNWTLYKRDQCFDDRTWKCPETGEANYVFHDNERVWMYYAPDFK